MAMKVFLDTDAHRFMKVLREQVEDMDARYSDVKGVHIWLEEYWEGRSGYDVAMVLIDDGLLYRAEVFIGHPVFKDMDPSDCEGRGMIPLEVTPLDRDIHAPNIQVRFDYDPSCEHPEVLPYVRELFEGLIKAWPTVRPQLVGQADLFDAPTHSERGPNTGTIFEVAKAFLLWNEQGKLQKDACELAGTSPNTLRKWQDDPRTKKEIERLKAEPQYPNNLYPQ
jgi:hypothetical protein